MRRKEEMDGSIASGDAKAESNFWDAGEAREKLENGLTRNISAPKEARMAFKRSKKSSYWSFDLAGW